MELLRENNNNLVNSEHQDDNSWCTVRSKKPKEKRSRRRLKSFESSLPPIFESVSDDEVYFSSSGDGSDDDANSLDSSRSQTPKNLITNHLRKNSTINNNNNVVKEIKLEDLNKKNSEMIMKDQECWCTTKKLDLLEDKDMFLRSRVKLIKTVDKDGDIAPGPGQCSQCFHVQSTMQGFTKYFQQRNSMEKKVLDDETLELINNANKFRTGGVSSSNNNSSWRWSPPPKLTCLNSSLPPLRPSAAKSRTIINNQNSPDDGRKDDIVATSGTVRKEPVKVYFDSERCSVIEKSLQDTKLRLQNLYDNLESLRVDSTIHFSRLIQHLEI